MVESVLQIADQTDAVAERLLVQAALKSLSAQQRAVLLLIYEHGLVLREVAEVLEIPMGTAASHLARGKAAVAAFVDLVPELENSAIKSIAPRVAKHEKIDVAGVELAEVVEND